MTLDHFRSIIDVTNPIEFFRDGLIGEGVQIDGTNGRVPLVYADYVASGRALKQVEDFVRDHVLPYYANCHTEASFTGRYMTRLRNEARQEIARLTGADESCAVVFSGSGATAGINRLVSLFGIPEAQNPVVFIGPYEHHSNILPWRESKAKVVEIPEDPKGGPNLNILKSELERHSDNDLIIGSFSAASNVTGILTDVDAVTKLLKSHGALSVWDYAGAGPYINIDMGTGTDAPKDAIVVSPHKFPGGPGSSGVFIVRKSAVSRRIPTYPGGGTVTYVSSWGHDYSENLSSKEEAGTPNSIGDIRAALAFMVKDAIGCARITQREDEMNAKALAAWQDNPKMKILGLNCAHRLPFFSFVPKDIDGEAISPTLFTKMLSDQYGVQARGGCSCAGPYGHILLEIDEEGSHDIRERIQAGDDNARPGWVRLNFGYLMDDKTVDYIIDSVNGLCEKLGNEKRAAGF